MVRHQVGVNPNIPVNLGDRGVLSSIPPGNLFSFPFPFLIFPKRACAYTFPLFLVLILSLSS